MKEKQFYIVDVFAEKKYAGNQLAVFRDGYNFSDEEMQQIAREMNFSETTFILSDEPENNGYNVRIFTPAREVPFAGHPTLGTAYIIQREIIKQPAKIVNLNLKIGQIPIELSYNSNEELEHLTMKQKDPTFGSKLSMEALSAVLGIDKNEIDGQFPVQEVSTGIPFIIVPIRTLKSIKRIKVDTEEYFKLIENTHAKAIHVFCPETEEENHIHVRMFAYYYGVPEDPATGSAAGCLAAYLVKHRFYGQDNIDIRVEQGYEIGRPSLLFLRAHETENQNINVYVGGQVQMVASGKFL